MIDYSKKKVESLSETEMNHLIGLKFVETNPSLNDLTREKLPENCRVIPPGSMVTMDFQEDRLNVYLDEADIVKKVKKG